MRLAPIRLCLLAAVTLASFAAQAKDLTASTSPGKEVQVAHHTNLGGSCTGNIPPIDISQPAHGKVDVRPTRYVLKGGFGTQGTSCNGREVDGGAIWYTPAAGYQGSDSFSYTVRYGTKRATVDTNTVTVTVK